MASDAAPAGVTDTIRSVDSPIISVAFSAVRVTDSGRLVLSTTVMSTLSLSSPSVAVTSMVPTRLVVTRPLSLTLTQSLVAVHLIMDNISSLWSILN